MKHEIAFFAIGLVLGYGMGRRSRLVVIPIILGLVGAFAGGELLITHKYVSLLGAVIGALILGWAGTALTRRRA